MPVERVVAPGYLREQSLGWLSAAWMEHFCVHDPGDMPGASRSDELTMLLADSYALDREGRRLYDSVFFSHPKGADKSGQAARIALFEAFGPCRFGGWAADGETFEWMDFRYSYEPGEPMGRPVTYPFLRCMATEEGQTGNVYDAIYYNLTEGPLREAFDRRGDVGAYPDLPPGWRRDPSVHGVLGLEGRGPGDVDELDETHLYLLPNSSGCPRRSAATWQSAQTRSRGRSSPQRCTSRAAVPSPRNRMPSPSASARGRVRRARMLFDHREPPADVDLRDEQSLQGMAATSSGGGR